MMTLSVRYTLRKNLGNYEHEELSCEIHNDLDDPKTWEEMFAEAKVACHTSSVTFKTKKEQTAPSANGVPL